MTMNTRREFIKMLGIAGVASVLPNSLTDNLILPVSNNNSNMAFNTNGVERMRIMSSGNIGIGTIPPSREFHISNMEALALSGRAACTKPLLSAALSTDY